jgi:hypothetical protein
MYVLCFHQWCADCRSSTPQQQHSTAAKGTVTVLITAAVSTFAPLQNFAAWHSMHDEAKQQ